MEPKTPISGRRNNSVFRVNKPTRYTLQRKWFQSVEAVLVQRDVFGWMAKTLKRSPRLNSSTTLSSHLNNIEQAIQACESIANNTGSKETTEEESMIEKGFSVLADGDLLCELVWCIDDQALDIHKVQMVEEGPSGRRAFMRRDNISRFLSGCQRLGISKGHLFDPSSLISLAAQSPGQGAQHVHRKQVLATLTTLMDHAQDEEENSSEDSYEDSYDSSSEEEEENNNNNNNNQTSIKTFREDALLQKISALEKELKKEREERCRANEMLKSALAYNSALAKENYFLKKGIQPKQ